MATDSTSEVILSDEELFRVSTDLEDYAPGSTAIITAEGVDVGGSVTFEVEHVTDAGEDGVYGTADDTTVDLGGDGHDSWTVVDGGEGDLDGEANGAIVTSWYVNPDDSLDETFLLSADDGTDVTYDSFTDSHTPELEAVVDNDPDADYLPLLNWNDHGTIGDAWFVQGHVHDTDSTGTGNILPFVRIQSTESEEGYNSSYRPTEFDEDTNDNWNHDLLLEQIPIVTGIDVDLDGIIDVAEGEAFYQFRLDLNEKNSTQGVHVSLDELQIYLGTSGGYHDFTIDEGFYNGDDTLDSLSVYNLDATFGEDVYILINDVEPGSGRSDMYFYLSVDDVAAATGGDDEWTHLYLYSKFGENHASDATFEEWSVSKWAAIDLEKYVSVDGQTSWHDADSATGPETYEGDDVWFKFTIENTGNVDLTNVSLTDDIFGELLPAGSVVGITGDTDSDGVLDFDETWELIYGPEDAILGQHVNIATVTASASGFDDLSDSDAAHYFGNPKVNIFGSKFEDDDGDGVQDAGEDAPATSFQMGLYIVTTAADGSESVSAVQATVWTDTNGDFAFNDLALLADNQEYRVRELGYEDAEGAFVAIDATESDWVATTANPVDIDPSANADGIYNISFGNFDLFDLSGTKYEDMDGDGDMTDVDPGWGGVTVFIDQNDNQTLDEGELSTTTAGNGSWSFTGLDASYAGGVVMEEVPDGSYQTYGNAGYTVTGTSGADQSGLDFANTKYGKITVKKYIDADGDLGTTGDQTVKAGWSIGLFDANDVQIGASVDTDANGVVVFDNLAPGTYTVKEATPEGWKVLGDAEVTLSDLESGFDETVDFYNFELFDLSGTKYEDMDGDGDMTDVDPGWGGVTVFIDQNDNQTLDAGELSTTTAGDGSWSFTGLDASYAGGVVMEEVPDGSYQTYGNAGYTVTGTSGADQSGLDFANTKYGKITVKKYIDADGDLGTTGDQTVKAGWSIGLFDADGVQIGASVDTDANGVVVFDNLAPGTYTVKEATPEGWKVLGDAEVTLSDLESGFDETVDFYNFELFDLSGMKYEDMNGDGDTTGDGGWGGVTVFIDQNDNQTLDEGELSTTTAGNGSWSFTGLDASYAGGVVMEEVPDGSYQTLGNAGYTVTGTSGADQSGLDFANTRYGSIEGYKFFDVSRDGTWDADESGALGWTIELYLDDGNGTFGAEDGAAVQTDVSDADGFWTFTGLEMGTYYVKEVLKSGWIQTTPEMNGDGYFKVVVDESGEVVISAVDQAGALPNDGLLYFGNDMIEGPGVRTPGFWKSDLGQTYWDGDDTNEGMVEGTGVDFQKEGDEFAENDLFELNYPAYFDGLDADGGINFTPDAGDLGAYPTYKEKGEDLPYLLVGDWDWSASETGDETVREYTLAEALIALEGGEDSKGKNTDYAKVSTVERDLIASWLNHMSGNAVDTEVEGQTIGYWIDQAILYVEHADGKTRKDGKTEWNDGVDIDGDDIIDTAAGSDIHTALDGWNNWGVLAGEQVTFDADDGQDLTSQAYYDAVA